MKNLKKVDLASFQDVKLSETQLKNLVGGCHYTSWKSSDGRSGTDGWCDNNGDGNMTLDEITFFDVQPDPGSVHLDDIEIGDEY